MCEALRQLGRAIADQMFPAYGSEAYYGYAPELDDPGSLIIGGAGNIGSSDQAQVRCPNVMYRLPSGVAFTEPVRGAEAGCFRTEIKDGQEKVTFQLCRRDTGGNPQYMFDPGEVPTAIPFPQGVGVLVTE
jgi:hypothetical protein